MKPAHALIAIAVSASLLVVLLLRQSALDSELALMRAGLVSDADADGDTLAIFRPLRSLAESSQTAAWQQAR
jgi:hypothetical protein